MNRQGVSTQLYVWLLKTPLQTVPGEQLHCRVPCLVPNPVFGTIVSVLWGMRYANLFTPSLSQLCLNLGLNIC
jgi:hypothetical protein